MNPALAESYRYHKRASLRVGYPRQLVSTDALNKARRDVAEGKRRYTSTIYQTSLSSPYRRETGQPVFIEDLAAVGLRFVAFADHWMRGYGSHQGWYADECQESVYRGCAVQLPGRNGESRFLAAYQESVNGGYLVDLGTIYSDPRGDYCAATDLDEARSAAQDGDSMAERAAEKEREYQIAWRAGSNFAEAGEEIRSLRRQALDILAERRRVAGVDAPTLCAVIRGKVSDIVDDIERLRAQREKLAAGDADNLCFYPGDARLAAAFAEGANL